MPKKQDIEGLAGSLPTLIAALKDELAATVKAMTALKRAGLIYAKPHWRERKYLYLIYPTTDGDRQRKYVGTDPRKVKRAQDAIDRAKKYDALKKQATAIEYTLYQGCCKIQEAVKCLAGADDW